MQLIKIREKTDSLFLVMFIFFLLLATLLLSRFADDSSTQDTISITPIFNSSNQEGTINRALFWSLGDVTLYNINGTGRFDLEIGGNPCKDKLNVQVSVFDETAIQVIRSEEMWTIAKNSDYPVVLLLTTNEKPCSIATDPRPLYFRAVFNLNT